MAQEPRSPWSRWDFPVDDVRQGGSAAMPRQYDFPPPPPNIPGNYILPAPPPASNGEPIGAPRFVEATLITKELNANDPSFYNCIYGVPNSLQQVIQECHIDVDCCETTCCDSNWRTKYAFAVALLCLFCAIVLISLLIWLIVWLVNRSRDKKQREKYADPNALPYCSQVNLATQYATIQQHQQSNPTRNSRLY